MDIAKLLRAIVGEGAVANQAQGPNAAGLAGSAAEAFGSLLAQALDAKSADGQGQPEGLPPATGPPVDPNAKAPPAEPLPPGSVPVLLVPVPQPDATLTEALIGASDQRPGAARAEADDQLTGGARVLDLALLTALVTWVDHVVGARGSRDVTTAEGRQVGSLSSDLSAALRQAIEETLAALDRQDTPIPQGTIASLEAIRDAVTVAAPKTIGGPLPEAQVRAYAEQLADSLVKAVSARFDYGAALLRTVLDALGGRQRTEIVQPTLPDRLRAEQLMNLLGAQTESGQPQMRDAVQALLDALRGEVTRVAAAADMAAGTESAPSFRSVLPASQPQAPRPDAPAGSAVSVSQATQVAPLFTEAVTAEAPLTAAQPQAERVPVAAEAPTAPTVRPTAASPPAEPPGTVAPVAVPQPRAPTTVAPVAVPQPRAPTTVTPAEPVPEPRAPRIAVLATTPVEEMGTTPAFVASSPRLTEAIEGTLVQTPAGRSGVTVPEQTGIVEAAEAYLRSGLGEARELMVTRRQPATANNTLADDILEATRSGPGSSTGGQVVLEGTDGRHEVLSGDGLARLLAVLSGDERVDSPSSPARTRPEGTRPVTAGAAAPGPLANAVVASVTQAQGTATDGARSAPDVRDAMAERTSDTIMTQIDQGMHAVAQRGRQEVTIELKPPYLGDIQVTLRATEQAVTAHFQAQSHTVKALLESNMHLLRDMLHDAGLSADVLEVSVGLGGPGDGGAYRNPGEATRLYQVLDPRHQAAPVELPVRPVGERVGSVYGLANVVDLLA